MSNDDEANLQLILVLAERELAAFLNATKDLLGNAGSAYFSEIWFTTMESLLWPDDNFPRFLRSVSIQAISQIVVCSFARVTGSKSASQYPCQLPTSRGVPGQVVPALSNGMTGAWYEDALLAQGRSN